MLLGLVAMLGGCGQTGPLYLPAAAPAAAAPAGAAHPAASAPTSG